jgi:SAM-dependent methyltransferase
MTFSIKTDHPVAIDSNDHLHPKGTKDDNHTSLAFIEDIENYFGNKKITFMDLGCAGGQLAVDFANRGHKAIGLEGSNYSAINGRACWAEYYNKNLFTCDIKHPFTVLEDGEPILFDCISSWEVLEHIKRPDLPQMLQNVANHMKPDGIFCASITHCQDFWDNGQPPYTKHYDILMHETVEEPGVWYNNILAPYFELIFPYPFRSHVRDELNAGTATTWFMAKKK